MSDSFFETCNCRLLRSIYWFLAGNTRISSILGPYIAKSFIPYKERLFLFDYSVVLRSLGDCR